MEDTNVTNDMGAQVPIAQEEEEPTVIELSDTKAEEKQTIMIAEENEVGRLFPKDAWEIDCELMHGKVQQYKSPIMEELDMSPDAVVIGKVERAIEINDFELINWEPSFMEELRC